MVVIKITTGGTDAGDVVRVHRVGDDPIEPSSEMTGHRTGRASRPRQAGTLLGLR
jgi:hypothetical protein